jgi:hypothetical protein
VISLFLKLKEKISDLLIFLAVFGSIVLSTYLKGRSEGATSEKQKQKDSLDKAKEDYTRITNDVEKESNAGVDKRASRWVRDE